MTQAHQILVCCLVSVALLTGYLSRPPQRPSIPPAVIDQLASDLGKLRPEAPPPSGCVTLPQDILEQIGNLK